jgi:hypothetical protein
LAHRFEPVLKFPALNVLEEPYKLIMEGVVIPNLLLVVTFEEV